ncbi:predicted protein [Nematostella vectensis]|uniref:Uncharacterized protein n=1 Tax=Nematostella vectensis TaxID=45351 RepID=A7RTG7_NEMVE|nr:predicted protein [Nematostella vectensis]|eukprot:XP_001637274.1 predicted protein [Nematostella vectensis]
MSTKTRSYLGLMLAFFAVFWSAIVTSSARGVIVHESCPKNWTLVKGLCVSTFTYPASWATADSDCRASNASLISLSSNISRNDAILRFLRNSERNITEFHLGLMLFNKSFSWSDSTKYNYTNWQNTTAVSQARNRTNETFCACVNSELSLWSLDACNKSRRFACQRPPDISWSCPETYCNSKCSLERSPQGNQFCNCTPVNWCPKNNPWGQTCVGRTAYIDCSQIQANRQGQATRRCSKINGLIQWEKQDTSSCKVVSTRPLSPTSPFKSSVKPSKDPSSNNSDAKMDATAAAIRDELNQLKGKPLSEAEATQAVQKFAGELGKMAEAVDMTPENINKVVQTAEEIGEVIGEGIKLSGPVLETKTIQSYTPGLDFGVSLVPNDELLTTKPTSNGEVRFPKDVFQRAHKEGITGAVGVTMSYLHESGNQSILNSGILSTTVQNVSGDAMRGLKEPVVIVLNKTKSTKQKSMCVYLDVSKSQAEWSTFGCWENTSNATHLECHCNHTTSFSLLLDVHGVYDDGTIPKEHRFALQLVSLIGCGVALLCFVAALLAFHITGKDRHRRKTETMTIHKHFAIAQIFALTLFLVAYVAVDIYELCYAVVVMLHYSFLAVFLWMLIEGFNLHRGLVQVFLTSSRMKAYCLLGWLTPAVVVAITAGVTQGEYIRDDFCWISYKYIWVFAGPVAAIILINFVILVIAIRVMIRRSRYKINHMVENTMSEMEKELRIAFKTTIILMPLLGLTWCLGFFAAHDSVGSLVIQYAFAIINSLQGLYFFIAHCLYDEDVIRAANNTSVRVKTMFRRTLSHHTASSNVSGSNESKRVKAEYNEGAFSPRIEHFDGIAPDLKLENIKDTELVNMPHRTGQPEENHPSLSPPDLKDAPRSEAHSKRRPSSARARANSTDSDDSVFHESANQSETGADTRPRTRTLSGRSAASTESSGLLKRTLQRVASADQKVHSATGSPTRSRVNSNDSPTPMAWGSPTPLSRPNLLRLKTLSDSST